jgi:hypothetical protein
MNKPHSTNWVSKGFRRTVFLLTKNLLDHILRDNNSHGTNLKQNGKKIFRSEMGIEEEGELRYSKSRMSGVECAFVVQYLLQKSENCL